MTHIVKLRADNEESGPVDRYNLVYYSVMIVGFGVLMPWNMFITIAPDYYVKYWFTPNGTETWFAKEFMGALSISSQLPNAAINVLNIFLVISGPLIYRVVAPVVVNIINVGAVLLLVILLEPSASTIPAFFAGTLAIVVFINISNGLYENSVFGVFADFPHCYTSSLIIGNNLCGLIVAGMSITVTMIFHDVRMIAMVYFGISLFILIMCGLALLNITKQEFYHYYHTKGIEIRTEANAHRPSAALLWQAFKSALPQLYNVWMSFSVTLAIFPVISAATTRDPSNRSFMDRLIPDELFTSITTFLLFNIFSFIGATVTSYIHWPNPRNLWILTTLRVLFVPFFFFCNYRVQDRVYPVYFSSTEAFVLGGILMAFTSGYCTSLSMMYTPRVVPPALSRFAAQISVCCLMLGLLSGAIVSLLIGHVVTTPIF